MRLICRILRHPRPKQEPSAVATTRFWVTSEAAWRSRAFNGNGSVLAVCEAVSLSAFVTRCRLTSEAAWDSRALNGDGQRGLSVRLLCQGTSTAA